VFPMFFKDLARTHLAEWEQLAREARSTRANGAGGRSGALRSPWRAQGFRALRRGRPRSSEPGSSPRPAPAARSGGLVHRVGCGDGCCDALEQERGGCHADLAAS
jgi:hypothetical protein